MKYIKPIVAIILLIALDQFTKILAVTYLKGKDGVNLIGDAFQLFYLENKGAAFGMLQNKQGFFLIITIIVLVAIVFLYLKVPSTKMYLPLRVCMVLIVSGAVGNMIDRISKQYVVDFLYFRKINFPVFNVADCYVTIAVAVLAILLLFVYKDEDLDFISFRQKKNEVQ